MKRPATKKAARSSRKRATRSTDAKKKTTTTRTGRPRTRSGDEVAVTVEMPVVSYAQLCAYVKILQEEAFRKHESIGDRTRKGTLLRLWAEFYASLDYKARQKLEQSETYRLEMKRMR